MHLPSTPSLSCVEFTLLTGMRCLSSVVDVSCPTSVTLNSTTSPLAVPTAMQLLSWFQQQQVKEVGGEKRVVETTCSANITAPSLASTTWTWPVSAHAKKNELQLDHAVSVMFGRPGISYSKASTPALFLHSTMVPQLSKVTSLSPLGDQRVTRTYNGRQEVDVELSFTRNTFIQMCRLVRTAQKQQS